jgi:ATPase subunit of ABC transporter with duplicated ATPase domains
VVVRMIEEIIAELCPEIAEYDADVERKYREAQERLRRERAQEEEQRRKEKEEQKRNKYPRTHPSHS